MMHFRGASVLLLFGGIFLLLVGMPLYPVFQLTWHDQQRIGQILIFMAVAVSWLIYFPAVLQPSIGKRATFLLICVLGVGGVSAVVSSRPSWAFAEVALFLCCTGFAYSISFFLRRSPQHGEILLAGFLRFFLLLICLQFYSALLSALMHADLYFHPWNLLDGFSNIRHQGQFLTIILPLLAGLWGSDFFRRRYPKWLDFSGMTTIAAMVFIGGTRGSVASWITVAVLFACIPGAARQMALRILLAVACGFLLAISLLELITQVSGQQTLFRFSGEQMFGLSAREQLWLRSFELIVSHPWLGIGPMQYAGEKLGVGAHPHQAVLQVATEWGLPALGVVLYVVVTWLRRAFSRAIALNNAAEASLSWGLLFALSAALVQSQVDGVLVMPYPQLWLTIVAGWAIAKFHRPAAETPGANWQIPAWLIGLLLLVPAIYLGFIVQRDFSLLVQAPEYCSSGPRFWCNGGIAH